jgi:hypothetical protein
MCETETRLRLTVEEREILAAYVNRHGIRATADVLKMSRHAIPVLVAGIEAREGTVVTCRTRLPRLTEAA